MRLGILTFHRAFNCGAMLQAWALKTVLEQMGHEVMFPECNRVGVAPRWRSVTKPGRGLRGIVRAIVVNALSVGVEDLTRRCYRSFAREHLPMLKCSTADFSKHFDAVVIGSDQVWSLKHILSEAPLFLGESISPDLPKVAYAASCGDRPADEAFRRRLGHAIEGFSAISVRERLTRDQFDAAVRSRIAEVADPTLLLRRKDYEGLEAGETPREPYMFVYALSVKPGLLTRARALARKAGLRLVIAAVYQYSRYHAAPEVVFGVSPDRMLALIRDAQCVLASSFHGTVFSILYGKPFLSIRNEVDDFESRPAALLNRLGASERLIGPTIGDEEAYERLMRPLPDFEAAGLEAYRATSREWLGFALSRLNRI